MRFVSWLIGLGLAVGALGLCGVALAALLGFVHPALDFFNHVQPLIIAGLVGVLLVALVPWWPKLARRAAIGLAIVGLVFSGLVVGPEALSAFTTRPAPPTDGRPVYRLMSHNLFGLNYDMEAVAARIFAADPDILAFQEYFEEQSSKLHPLLRARYPHFARCFGSKRAYVAIYSKVDFRFANNGSCAAARTGRERTAQIIAEFTGADGHRFSVVTTHLDWPLQISKLNDGDGLREGLRLAVARQQDEFADLKTALDAIEGPLVLAGDFNSTSWSYSLNRFAESAGLMRETRSLLTWPTLFYIKGWRTTLPLLPLDQIMVRGGVAVHSVKSADAAGSDHLAVIAEFSIP